MNVDNTRDIDKVIVLGSGMSILDLTEEEIKYINRCKTTIAMNKYMAFYKKVGIIPTHIYFHDVSGYNIYLHILNLCKRDELMNLTFITNSFFKNIAYKNFFDGFVNFLKDIFIRLYSFAVIIYRLGKTSSTHYMKAFRKFKYLKIPETWNIIPIKVTNWTEGGAWASNIGNTIFHYRGSLTSVLNVISIISPNQEVFLVGNDFSGDKYFYEKELEDLKIPWKDFTYETVKKTGMHFSFQKFEGMTILDKFPFIQEKLIESGNQLYCNNRDSLLVLKAGVKYKPII